MNLFAHGTVDRVVVHEHDGERETLSELGRLIGEPT
jgi:hypothetical protein